MSNPPAKKAATLSVALILRLSKLLWKRIMTQTKAILQQAALGAGMIRFAVTVLILHLEQLVGFPIWRRLILDVYRPTLIQNLPVVTCIDRTDQITKF